VRLVFSSITVLALYRIAETGAARTVQIGPRPGIRPYATDAHAYTGDERYPRKEVVITVNHHAQWPGGRGFNQPPGAGGPWPGGTPFGPPADPFAGPPALLQSVQYPGLGPAPGAPKAPGLPNLADLKLIIDRMGGIDGILSTVQKVQKIVGTVQQFAPMIKLLAGSLSKKTASAASADAGSRPRRRRRRGRRRRAGRPRRGARRRSAVIRGGDHLL